jgi:hypothetical protein
MARTRRTHGVDSADKPDVITTIDRVDSADKPPPNPFCRADTATTAASSNHRYAALDRATSIE